MRVSGTEVTDSRSSTYDKDKLCSCFKKVDAPVQQHTYTCRCVIASANKEPDCK